MTEQADTEVELEREKKKENPNSRTINELEVRLIQIAAELNFVAQVSEEIVKEKDELSRSNQSSETKQKKEIQTTDDSACEENLF